MGLLTLGLWGCVGETSPGILPNNDPTLRESGRQLRDDASKRVYEADAPRGGEAEARAQYNLMSKNFDLVNLSDEDWQRVDVWINQKYVLHVARMEKQVAKRLDFDMFYDQNGEHFKTEDGNNPLQSLEIFCDGKMYTVATTME